MIRPQPCRCIYGATALAQRKYPTTFVSISSSKASSLASARAPRTKPPGVAALLTRISTLPKVTTVVSTMRRTDSQLVVSVGTGRIRRPVSCSSSPAAASSASRCLAQMATSTPSFASSRAMALPTPLLAPVMTATLPVNSRSILQAPIRKRLQIFSKPVEDIAKALQAVAWLAGAGHLVILIREAHEEDLLVLPFQCCKQLFSLLYPTAQIVFSVQDEQRCGDIFGIRQWRMVDVPLHVVPGQSPTLRLQERGTNVAGAEK